VCQAKASRILEQEKQAKKEPYDTRRRENEKRREVLRKASSIPHQEAEISMARRVENIIAPLAEEVHRLKELSEQKDRRALDAADPARDTGRFAANARAGTQPYAKLRPEHRREAPRARHTDPQRRLSGGNCEWRYATSHLRETTVALLQQLRHRQAPEKSIATPGNAEGANASAGSGAARTHEGNGHSLQEGEQAAEGGVDTTYASFANRAIGVGSRPTCRQDPYQNDPSAA
jgi:hypothetical protein